MGQLKNSVVHISLAMPANIRNPADRFKPFSPPPLMTYYRGFIKSVPPSQSTDGAMAEIGDARDLVCCPASRVGHCALTAVAGTFDQRDL